ncbi:MAG: cysteine--tRNA ligase [Candidatus Paceibacterota bacterium]|jgi:cysteinyl-tRNA synthetase
MRPVFLFDSLSGKKELVENSKGKPLRVFVCGPTVYDYPHIGNARTYLIFDALVKFLRSQSIKVFYLQNITDVDDKIIARAENEKMDWKKISKKFFEVYRRNMKQLGIDSVTKYAPATKFIPAITKQVQKLLEKGNAYKIDGDGYYFDISTFPDYGKLAKRTAEQAEDGVSRIDQSINKKNKGDFALWKFSKPGEPSWKSSLGAGRPGWHIEDTAISEHFFGPQYDLHGGAMDLKFPHHEAEIAQQESASGKKPFVKIWVHVGFLTANGEKMSKSLGNFVTIEDFLKKHPAEVLRMITLSHHYRSPLNYTDELAQENLKRWQSILEFLGKLDFVSKNFRKVNTDNFSAAETLINFERKFLESLGDDFGTPGAMAEIFSLINTINPNVYKLDKSEANGLIKKIRWSLKILGLKPVLPKTPAKVAVLAKKREKFRVSKQFVQSDGLRKEINDLGFEVEDTSLGPFTWPRE